MEIRPGDMLLVGTKGGNFFSRAIKFFSQSRWSHSAVGFFRDDEREVDQIFEANLLCQVTDAPKTVDNPELSIRVYRFRHLDLHAIDDALQQTYDEANGETYGFFEIPWFVFRWIVESVSKINMRKKNNPLPGNKICSQLTFKVDERYRDVTVFDKSAIDAALNCYKSGSVWPRDLEEMWDALVKVGVMEVAYERIV